ncbi:unnamed protein product [Lactuca virosa]|uniref:TFIIS N-terminal domain-containing protein n=1 Tax=Lactuca virosa TaxID=75947 RepID=A0AAU9PX65_9ASTR|nr:unnamed protein product [Lactuca virosa]
MFDIRSSEFNSSKKPFKKVTNAPKFGDEVDPDYSWLLNFLNENMEQTKPPMEDIIRDEDEDEDDNEHEDEDEDDDDDENEDSKYKDPQYCMFLKQLTENGKSYKLKISKDNEAPCFLEYEQPYNPSTDMNITLCNTIMKDMQIDHRSKRSPNGKKRKILMKKEVSSKIKTEPQNNLGKRVNYEEKVTNSNSDSDSDTDSDMMIWDKVRDLSEANKKQLVPTKKEPSLKEKLMRILKKPYNQKEYEELSEYIEEKKPICRLLPLRDRAISSALVGVTKSVLDDGPSTFRRKLKAVKNDRPRALNLLRMFRFWLEHLPNEKIFKPWLCQEFMEVLPSSRKKSHLDK